MSIQLEDCILNEWEIIEEYDLIMEKKKYEIKGCIQSD